MDLESLRYFMETAKSLSITETSERLFISQQTLSNHIRRVEDYCGTYLFNRQPRLQLTAAGQEVLKYAETIFADEKRLFAVLADLGNSDSGLITIGVTSPRCNAYLPQVLEKYSVLYPKVLVSFIESTNNELEHLVQKNQLDFAVGAYIEGSYPNIQSHSTHEDPIYFCVSDRLLYKTYTSGEIAKLKEKSLKGANVADFSRIPFMIPTIQNRLGERVLQCFQDALCTPEIHYTSKHTTMIIPLCNRGLAAGFTSHMNLSNWLPQLADDVNVFPLCQNGKLVTTSIKLIYHKQRYLNHFVKAFIQLTEEALDTLERQDLSRLSISLPPPEKNTV
ncbi:MAG: LysR family transcriptional regulator [Clostridium sp.]|nr:LysR family transcriptional regulator [Clostridium sp.]